MRSAVVMVTRKCNMSCAHCSVESHPGIKGEPTAEELRRTVMELGEAGVKGLQFTGGEPLIRHKLVFELMELAQTRYGIASVIVTNGFWGKKPDRAEEFYNRLRSLGLLRLTISYDRFHAKFLGPQAVRNILDVARREHAAVNINITRTKDDSELRELVEPFAEYENALFRFYDVQPVGLAASFEEPLRGQIEGFCSGCEQATVTDNGRVLACNGPSYFEKSHSALILGTTQEKSLAELLNHHESDPILQTIRLEGPLQLKKTLEQLPDFKDFPFKKNYSGMCQLCKQICNDPSAVSALREELSRPEKVALRLAQQQVKGYARGELWHREAVNGMEAQRAFFLALSKRADEYRDEIAQILNRADLDWYNQAMMMRKNGVLWRFRDQKEFIENYAPDFFWQLVEESSTLQVELTTLEQHLEHWRESDFQNLLGLAVLLEQSPALQAELSQATGPIPELARLMLSVMRLDLTRENCLPDSLVSKMRTNLARVVIAPTPYHHFNLLIKPGLHLLCISGPWDLSRGVRLALLAFRSGLVQCADVRGWKGCLQYLAKDLLKIKNLWS